jgi:hypothetical protein
MSQDLFEAFGAPQGSSSDAVNTSSAANNGTFSFFNDDSGPHGSGIPTNANSSGRQAAVIEEDDDWGEFEGVVEASIAPQQAQEPATVASTSRHHYDLDDLGPSKPKQSVLSPAGLNLGSLSLESDNSNKKAEEKQTNRAKKDPNVLFDASDEDSDEGDLDDFDDFGDFEQAGPIVHTPAPAEKPVQPAEIDLLGLNDDTTFQSVQNTKGNISQQVKSDHSVVKKQVRTVQTAEMDLLGLDDDISIQKVTASTEKKADPLTFGQTTAPKPQQRRQHEKPNSQPEESPKDETWDDFSAWDEDSSEPINKPAQEVKPGRLQVEKSGGIALPLLKGSSDSSKIDRPPTTIPPPALVLSLFSTIFEMVEKELLQAISTQTADVRKEVLCSPRTLTYLRGYHAILVVCAHVIAGRKLRWKRDTLLAQSMRIGSASSGRLSGMKVTSIDKSEVSREDREVAEVLRIWNSQVGRLKAIIAEAKKESGEQLPSIPELRETMPVKVASELEGGVSGVKSCALCGLRRAERVGKVDVEVEDSFGEWWVDEVIMHRGMPLVYCNEVLH